jgi:hypothetical protein
MYYIFLITKILNSRQFHLIIKSLKLLINILIALIMHCRLFIHLYLKPLHFIISIVFFKHFKFRFVVKLTCIFFLFDCFRLTYQHPLYCHLRFCWINHYSCSSLNYFYLKCIYLIFLIILHLLYNTYLKSISTFIIIIGFITSFYQKYYLLLFLSIYFYFLIVFDQPNFKRIVN